MDEFDMIDIKLRVLYQLGHIHFKDEDDRHTQIAMFHKCLDGYNRIQLDNWAHDIIVNGKSPYEIFERGTH